MKISLGNAIPQPLLPHVSLIALYLIYLQQAHVLVFLLPTASGVLSSFDHQHHHSHLLLQRNHLDARNQQLTAGHVYRLDSPPSSSFELMTVVDDDDDDVAGEGSGGDTHSVVGKESVSGSASPAAGRASIGNNNANSITGIMHPQHEQQWQQHHNRSHHQHFHAYPGKDDQTRGHDDDQDDAGVDAHDECNVRKIRRNRTVFTELQLMGLERRFDSQKYLSTPDRADLARVLGLTQLQVKTWYQVRERAGDSSLSLSPFSPDS